MRQATQPSRSSRGPLRIKALSAAWRPSSRAQGRPGRDRSRKPATPSAVQRCTQSPSVWPLIPASSAALSRGRPSSALASASSRAPTRLSCSRRASRRSSAGSRAVRIDKGAGMAGAPNMAAAGTAQPPLRSVTTSADRYDKWHLDEVVITIAGQKHWLWQAVDQEGFVLDVLVQSRRDKKAAKRLLRKLLKKQGRPPRVLITDKLRSYGAAKREVMPGVEHRQHKGLNNRAENSHQPTRRRERIMKRFKSPRQVQRFLSVHDQIANVFARRPSQDTAIKFHAARDQAFAIWAEVTGVAMAA